MGDGATQDQPWTTEGQEKRAAVQALFSNIAGKYDAVNSIMSLSMHHSWRRNAVEMLELHEGDATLDVCCGTGDFMVPLFDKVGADGLVAGIDFCLPMLKVSQEKLHTHRISLGDACRLPVASEVVDAVTVGWGIRNVPDIDLAHQEVFRVLRPGGRFVSIDCARPKNPFLRWLSRLVTGTVIPLIGRLTGAKTAYTYLPKSTDRFLSRAELKASMERAGFQDVIFRDLFLGNICIHWGKKS